MSYARQHAHTLIDRLPETQVGRVIHFLESLDPVSTAMLSASADDETETVEERDAVAKARLWLADRGGKGISHTEAKRKLGFD